MEVNQPDFTGWATKYNKLCSDGRTILDGAFAHNDQATVPLMWQHQHDKAQNVLGHAVLESRKDGMYARGYFNETETAQVAKELLRHGDITSLSVYANHLKQQNRNVLHGDIKELSLVMAGANPEAYIDYVNLQHSDDEPDEATIYSGELLVHADDKDEPVAETDTKTDRTVQEVLDTFDEDQMDVMRYLLEAALDEASEEDEDDDDDVEHSDVDNSESVEPDENLTHSATNQEGSSIMSRNVFDQTSPTPKAGGATLTHDQFQTIVSSAKKLGGSFKEAFLAHQEEFGISEADVLQHADYGIQNIDILFPEARATSSTPDFISRNTVWATTFLSRTKKLPFSRIKSVFADITADEARARGYITGKMKKDEVFGLLRRTTSPTTIYKKNKLDRDNMVDITDMDVVVWLKTEMRYMLNEEIARAALLGDGRETSDEDHVADPAGQNDGTGIRSIANDHEMYAHVVYVPEVLTDGALVERVLRSWEHYRGSGNTSFYTTDGVIVDMLLEKDKVGRRLYATEDELAAVLRTKRLVSCEVMKAYPEIVGIIVDEVDYSFGTNRGGDITLFDDFDIDYNQFKYLMETRLSGGLTVPKSAIVLKRTLANEVVPVQPSFDSATNKITIPTITGVEYFIDEVKVTGVKTITENTEVVAYPASGYVFPLNTVRNWPFAYKA